MRRPAGARLARLRRAVGARRESELRRAARVPRARRAARAAARQMGARHPRCAGLRRELRAQALHRAPGAPRARAKRRAHRAPVAPHRGRRAARRAHRRARWQPPRAGRGELAQRLSRRCARLHLPRRSARQPDDALSGRAGREAHDPGLGAPAEVFEVRMSAYRALCLAAVVLALVVVVMGAYVRLSDAGLGCPDWPLCYGGPLPAAIADQDALAKAWKEMGHRYLAGTLGAIIFLLGIGAWRLRRSRGLALAVVLLVVLQATLGKWTVTMLLKPAIVTAHLLGGMGTLALLVWLALAQSPPAPASEMRTLRVAAAIALAAAAMQVALGGWASANC